MYFLQWCRKFLHAQKKQCLPAISFPHPWSVNGTSLFYLIYCPVSVGPASVLSISYVFSWLFFLTIPFTTQKTLNSQSSMLLEWNGWKLHRDELGAKGNPTPNASQKLQHCWLKIAAYIAEGRNPFFSFKLWLEKSISTKQFISHWLAPLITAIQNTRLLCRA